MKAVKQLQFMPGSKNFEQRTYEAVKNAVPMFDSTTDPPFNFSIRKTIEMLERSITMELEERCNKQ